MSRTRSSTGHGQCSTPAGRAAESRSSSCQYNAAATVTYLKGWTLIRKSPSLVPTWSPAGLSASETRRDPQSLRVSVLVRPAETRSHFPNSVTAPGPCEYPSIAWPRAGLTGSCSTWSSELGTPRPGALCSSRTVTRSRRQGFKLPWLSLRRRVTVLSESPHR